MNRPGKRGEEKVDPLLISDFLTSDLLLHYLMFFLCLRANFRGRLQKKWHIPLFLFYFCFVFSPGLNFCRRPWKWTQRITESRLQKLNPNPRIWILNHFYLLRFRFSDGISDSFIRWICIPGLYFPQNASGFCFYIHFIPLDFEFISEFFEHQDLNLWIRILLGF